MGITLSRHVPAGIAAAIMNVPASIRSGITVYPRQGVNPINTGAGTIDFGTNTVQDGVSTISGSAAAFSIKVVP